MFNSCYNRTYYHHHVLQDERNVPEYEAVVLQYDFDEGQAPAGSINNIILDSRTPLQQGTNAIPNPNFSGTYVSGVAPDWVADASVSASEDSQKQQITNLSGTSQALHTSSAITLVVGEVYQVVVNVTYNSGTGDLQIQLTGMNGVNSTLYEIDNATLVANGSGKYYFYCVANSTSSTVSITSADTSLDVTLEDFSVIQQLGGNPMVMDPDVYDKANRGINYYDLNGTDQYFYIADSRQTGLDFGSAPFTIASIVQPVNAQTRPFAKWQTNGNNISYDFRIGSSGDLRLVLSDTGISATDTIDSVEGLSLPTTNFIYYSLAFNSGNAEGNLNGSALTLNYSSGPPMTTTSVYDGAAPASIGCVFGATSNPTGFMQGKVGKIIVWNGVALNQTQMVQVYNILRSGYGL